MKMTSEQKIALVQSINQTDDLMWSEISEWVHPYFILIWETFDHWHWMHSNPGIAIAYQDGCQLVELKTRYQIVFFEKLSFLFCCPICLRWKRSVTAKLLRKSAPPNKVISPCPAQLWDVLASQNAHNKISVLSIWPDITNWDPIQHQIRHSDYAFIKCLFPLASASAYWFAGLFSAITFGLKSFDFWLNSSAYCNSDVFYQYTGNVVFPNCLVVDCAKHPNFIDIDSPLQVFVHCF